MAIMMNPLVKLSGGQAWDEILWSLTSLSSSTIYLLAVTLLAVILLLLYLYSYRSDGVFSRIMVNSPAMNGKTHPTSKDFRGDIKVNNNPPSKERLEKIADLPVLDANKKPHTFKSLYADNENGPRRVLIIFIRHFFCGNCQEYLRTLSSSIPPSTLATLSPPTSIVVIGCGQPEMIPMYIRETSCPYPIYADPTRKLYDMLGMTKTLSLGPQAPEYLQRSLFSMAFSSFLQEIKSGRKLFSGGDYRQVGGEFLFWEGEVTFCKRMKNTRDHAEIPEVRKSLGLDREAEDPVGDEIPPARKRWSTSGLGAGLGRRLSNRRRSWAPQRSRSGNREAKGSPVRNGMQQLKEEADAEASATPEDALAKLEGKAAVDESSKVKEHGPASTPCNGVPNGIVNGTAGPIPTEGQKSDRNAINGSAEHGATSGLSNGHATA